MRGTFNVSRAIWNHSVFKPEPFSEREAFLWLISEAEWRPRTRRVGNIIVDLARGQIAASLRFMGRRWGWKKDRISRYLLRLKNRDMIKTVDLIP